MTMTRRSFSIRTNWCPKCMRSRAEMGNIEPRVLTGEELKKIWGACEDRQNSLPDHFRTIVQLLILTGMRRRAPLRASYIDLARRTICLPPTLVKKTPASTCFLSVRVLRSYVQGPYRSHQIQTSFFRPGGMRRQASTGGRNQKPSWVPRPA
jgi:integrase